jgi:uncharacterized protein YjdB
MFVRLPDLRRSTLPLLLAGLAACAGNRDEPGPTPGGQEVAVDVQPATSELTVGDSLQLAAAVTGTADTAVEWDVVEAGGGAVETTGRYTAPGSAGTFHVRASSRAAPGSQAVATVIVTAPPPPPSSPAPVTVTVAPTSGATNSCKTLTFSGTVTNATDTSVTWAVQEGAVGGTITAAGVYTAPASAGTYHVVATSRADATRSQIVPVSVTDKVLSVAVAPGSAQVQAGDSTQFTATVTTTCGTFASTAALGADGIVTAN